MTRRELIYHLGAMELPGTNARDFNDSEINLKMNTKKIITSKRDLKGMSLNQFRKEIKSL